MFIQTEATPNPATLKFLPGQTVIAEGTIDFRSAGEAQGKSPLAERLFDLTGVEGVFFGHDFVTVTKSGDPDWQQMKPAILGTIMEHFMNEHPVMTADVQAGTETGSGQEFFDDGDEDIVETIKDLLETRVRPAVAQDGGDITFRGFKKGVVYLEMRGACAGCPSSTATLQHGIQNLLKHFIPQVQAVEAVQG